jgi:hypothetical protein
MLKFCGVVGSILRHTRLDFDTHGICSCGIPGHFEKNSAGSQRDSYGLIAVGIEVMVRLAYMYAANSLFTHSGLLWKK